MTQGNSTTRCWYSSVDQGKRPKNEDTYFHGHITVTVPSNNSCAAHDESSPGSSGSSSTTTVMPCSNASGSCASCSDSAFSTKQEVLVAGCFDGHGGDSVSKHLAENMTSRICSLLHGKSLNNTAAVAQALTSAFTSIDQELKRSKQAHLVGSTAVVALVTDTMIHISSCGDSRAIICHEYDAVQPVQDHTPSREDERARIQQHGGHVLYCNGLRVMGALAMSRAIGDHALRRYDPDVAHHDRRAGDQYLVIASDGLWNAMSNKDVACIIQLFLSELSAVGLKRKQINALLPKLLTKVALQRGSTDNITVIMLDISSSRSSSLTTQQQQGLIYCNSSKAEAVTAIEIARDAQDKNTMSQLALQRIKDVIRTVSSNSWNSDKFTAMHQGPSLNSGSLEAHSDAVKQSAFGVTTLQHADEFLILKQPSVAPAGEAGSQIVSPAPAAAATTVAVLQRGDSSPSAPAAFGPHCSCMSSDTKKLQQQPSLWSSSSAPAQMRNDAQRPNSFPICSRSVILNPSTGCYDHSSSSYGQLAVSCAAQTVYESPFAAVQAATAPSLATSTTPFSVPRSCSWSTLQTPFSLGNCSSNFSNAAAGSDTYSRSVTDTVISGMKRRLVSRLPSANLASANEGGLVLVDGDYSPTKLQRLSRNAGSGCVRHPPSLCQVDGVGVDQHIVRLSSVEFAMKAETASVCA